MSSLEEKKYLRLIKFSYDLSVEVARAYTEVNILCKYNSCLVDFLNNHKHAIYHLFQRKNPCCSCSPGRFSFTGNIYMEQFYILYTMNGVTNPSHVKKNRGYVTQNCICNVLVNNCTLEDLDISLLHTLIVKCDPPTIHDEEAWLKSIRDIRNRISHVKSTDEFSSSVLDQLWSELESSVLGLVEKIPPKFYKDSIKKQISLLKVADFDKKEIFELLEAECKKIKSEMSEMLGKELDKVEERVEKRRRDDNGRLQGSFLEVVSSVNEVGEALGAVCSNIRDQQEQNFSDMKKKQQETTEMLRKMGELVIRVSANLNKEDTAQKSHIKESENRFIDIECQVEGHLIDFEMAVKELSNKTKTYTKDDNTFDIISAKEGSLILDLSANPRILQSEQTLKVAIRDLIERVIKADDIDTTVPGTLNVKLTFKSPLTEEELRVVHAVCLTDNNDTFTSGNPNTEDLKRTDSSIRNNKDTFTSWKPSTENVNITDSSVIDKVVISSGLTGEMSSLDERKYLRLIKFSYDLSLEVTRAYTEVNILSKYNCCLKDFLNNHKHKIYHMFQRKTPCCFCSPGCFSSTGNIYKEQFDILYTIHDVTNPGHVKKNGSYVTQHCICNVLVNNCTLEDLDISLLHTLIVKCEPSTCNDEETWLKSIRDIRNRISHVKSTGEFSSSMLDQIWSELESSVLGLAGKVPHKFYKDSIKKQMSLLKVADFDKEEILGLLEAERKKNLYENMAESVVINGDWLVVAAIDVGTTFSGYSFSFRSDFEANPIKINTNDWSAEGVQSAELKAPSVLLLNPDQSFNGFGYRAQNTYAALLEDDPETARKHYYVRSFKMQLYNREISMDMLIQDVSGKDILAIKVFTETIQFLKDHFIKMLNDRELGFTMKDIFFVVTVPAIWSDAAKQFMREASNRAGIDNAHMILAYEPEAASLYCSLLPEYQGIAKYFQEGRRLMIVDLGGGTADITVVKVIRRDEKLTFIEHVYRVSGGAWGGNQVNQNFEIFLEKVLGNDVFHEFKTEYLPQYIEMMMEFEIKKKTLSASGDRKVVAIKISGELVQLFKDKRGKDLKDEIAEKSKGQVKIVRDKLRFDLSIFKRFFQDCVANIINHINETFMGKGCAFPSSLILVGGFSDAPIIREAIRDAFPVIKDVVSPVGSSLAVLKGSVIFGHRPAIVTGRVCRETIGISLPHSVLPDKQSEQVKHRTLTIDGELQMENSFQKMFSINEVIKVGQTRTVEMQDIHKDPAFKERRKQPKIIEVYASENEDPKYITYPECKLKGRITVEPPKGGWPETVEGFIDMETGGTEIIVRYRDKHSGHTTEETIDFIMILVGGFSDAPIIREAIRDAFPVIKYVVSPVGSSLAVLKGSVIFGHRPAIVTGRVCRETIGISLPHSVLPDKQSEQVKHRTLTIDGELQMENSFQKMFSINEVIKVGQTRTVEMQDIHKDPAFKERRKQPKIIEVYASENEDPKYITYPECKLKGRITVEPPKGGWPETVEGFIDMETGGTEIIVRYRDKHSGHTTEETIDFM